MWLAETVAAGGGMQPYWWFLSAGGAPTNTVIAVKCGQDWEWPHQTKYNNADLDRLLPLLPEVVV